MANILTAEWKFNRTELTPTKLLEAIEPYLLNDTPISDNPKTGWKTSSRYNEVFLTKYETGFVLPGCALVLIQTNVSPNLSKGLQEALIKIPLEGLDKGTEPWSTVFGKDDSVFVLVETGEEKLLEDSILAVAHIRSGVDTNIGKVLVHELYEFRIRVGQPKSYFKTLLTLMKNALLVRDELGIIYTTTEIYGGVLTMMSPSVVQSQLEIQENSVLWVGCEAREKNDNDVQTLLFYEANGFYFPGHLPGFLGMLGMTPLGAPFPMKFLNGYISQEPVFRRFMASKTSQFTKVEINKEAGREIIGDSVKRLGSTEQWGMLNAPFERAGLFYGEGSTVVPHPAIIDGKPGPAAAGGCAVQIPVIELAENVRRFTWHSHPLTCHVSTGLLMGFPSLQDYSAHSYHFFKKDEDGHFVFGREGVFIMQIHPMLKDNTLYDMITDEVGEYITIAFLDYLKAVKYSEKRMGSDDTTRQLAIKMSKGAQFTAAELDYIYEKDNGAIGTLIDDIMSYTVRSGAMEVPFIHFQVIRRDALSSTSTEAATFFTPVQAFTKIPPAI